MKKEPFEGIHSCQQGRLDEFAAERQKNSFVILYCINRMCTVSFEAALEAINAGYENVYVMPDGIQGWVSNGYPFEGTS